MLKTTITPIYYVCIQRINILIIYSSQAKLFLNNNYQNHREMIFLSMYIIITIMCTKEN